HSCWILLAQFCDVLKISTLTSSVLVAITLLAVAPSTCKLSYKISTLPLCVTAAQFSHRLLLLFPSTIFNKVGARFFQERCLNFLCQVLHPWTTFSLLFGCAFVDPLVF
ncbi:hypothetical protein V8G54_002877, partial [Vigna mungo]